MKINKIQREYLINLSTFVPLGPVRLRLLLEHFGSFEKVWKANPDDLRRTGLALKIVQDFCRHRNSFDESKYRTKLQKLAVNTITIFDTRYPKNLKEIEDAPYVLYVRGNLVKSDQLSVAIVGSRKMTSYGKEACEIFSEKLSASGVTIVSGLARGIDTTAHKTAIKAGRTVAVIGSGQDLIYPPENTYLASEIVKKGSAVISEFPIGHGVEPYNFPIRNRIISGLSKAVLVVEGRHKSGTLLTASWAASQGRDVYAIPGNITSPMSEAPLYLLQNGAKAAVSPDDILGDLGIEALSNQLLPSKKSKPSYEEITLLGAISEPIHLDELARATQSNIGDLTARLTIMEIKGLVKNIGAGVYRKM